MRIVHISDLHIGNHNETLQGDLLARMRKIRPNVIVCTGDLIDDPDGDLASQAENYLTQLGQTCQLADAADPGILLVPGNHDYAKHGFLWKDRKGRFSKIIYADQTDHYFAQENVWIFGFDSASEGNVGGGGLCRQEDIARFHDRFRELESKPEFRDAFKIIAVHHHPLPVNWDDDWKQRWLTMTNAGPFLSAALIRGVDVVLHGHEHLQARAYLRSTLGGSADKEITVLSLGATLRKVENPNRNWFSVLSVERGNVGAVYYPSVGPVFSNEGEYVEIRSPRQRAEQGFERWKENVGYFYRELASITTITRDGDALRIVECDELQILREGSSRAEGHNIQLPYTSGYVDCLIAGSRDVNASIDAIPRGTRAHTFQSRIDFGGNTLAVGGNVSYYYRWYAVNSFAMDERQFDRRYSATNGSDDGVEFTHYVVSDPIEELTVVVRFPDEFALKEPPRLRITEVDKDPKKGSRTWKRKTGIEERLKQSRSLRFYQSLNIAALRVSRPVSGVSYGIEWRVPELPDRKKSAKARLAQGRIQQLRHTWATQTATEAQRLQLSGLLSRVMSATRQLIFPEWNEPVEISVMYLDTQLKECKLRLLAAALVSDTVQEITHTGFDLEYGDGIAGRAFKANEFRVYAPLEDDDPNEPDYYTSQPGRPVHRVILAIPLQNPEDREDEPYGVLNLSSERSDCPLALAGLPEGPAPPALLQEFHSELNVNLLQGLAGIYLNRAKLTGGNA